MKDVNREVIWTKLDLLNSKYLFLPSFHWTPADHSMAQLLELKKSLTTSNLTRNNPDATIIVGGDFKAGDIDGETNSVPTVSLERQLPWNLLQQVYKGKLQDFFDCIQKIIDARIHTKMSPTQFNVPWFNDTLKRMCKKKQRLC